MNHYNRSNPFLYVIDHANDLLIYTCNDTIKSFIISFILVGIYLLTSIYCIFTKFTITDISILFIFLIVNWILFQRIKLSIQENRTTEINAAKYPEDFLSYSFINNEKLLEDVTVIYTHIGKVESLKETILMLNIVEVISIGINIVKIISLIYK